MIRVRLRKRRMLKLKVRSTFGKAYNDDEKMRMLREARKARSPHIYLALTMALNAGMRDAEIKTLTWAQINFPKEFLAVGRSKTEGGEGRTIPLNSSLFAALSDYAEWHVEKFGEIRPEWYIFPFGKPSPSDPTRPVTSLKTAWNNVRKNAKVTGRFHDNRHTLITELAESGAGDQTIMDIAGHVSKQMLKHYSHIRMEAKRTALESIVKKQTDPGSSDQHTREAEGAMRETLQGLQNGAPRPTSNHATRQPAHSATVKKTEQQCSELPINTQHFEEVSLQKSLQCSVFEGHRGVGRGGKSKKRIGSSGRTRIRWTT
jgi:hypothetical protein